MVRLRPNIVYRLDVANQSRRDEGTNPYSGKPLLIVLHSTEGKNIPGKQDLINLGAWFNNPAANASSHVAVDAEGQSARFVNDNKKAWTCAWFNSVSLNIECIGFAQQRKWTDAEAREVARWCAKWSLKFGIPLKHGRVSGTRVIEKGIIRHSELGVAGGDHHDPGKHFPFLDVVTYAHRIKRELKEKR